MTKISSLSEYVQEVEKILQTWSRKLKALNRWFRGQSCESWELLPSIYRPPFDFRIERELIRDSRLLSNTYLDRDPENDMELFFAMQHFGLPTRLLDWSESHLVALFFAVENETHANADGVVWILRGAQLNEHADPEIGHHVPMYDHPVFDKYSLEPDARDHKRHSIAAKYPLAVRPRRSTNRVIAQRGTFTIHGSKRICLRKFEHANELSLAEP